MSKRNNWVFAYPADILLQAATEKMNYHAGRYEWWQTERERITEKIKKEGIMIDESVAALNLSSNYARQPSVMIDVQLQRDLEECNQKVQEHRNKTESYAAWVETLNSQGKTSFDLDVEDWQFFFRAKN